MALFVLSFGMLGISGLQIQAQQFNRNAAMNTQATILAHDMIERMRANTAGLALNSNSYHLPASVKHESCYSLAGCSVQEMAENDMYEWGGEAPGSVASKLPGGVAEVCIDSTPDDGTPAEPACDASGNIYALKVWWHGKDSEIKRVVTTVAFN